MRIDKLTLTNYKCFENETFHFNPHFNVIIGKNGIGKTSLLDAIAHAVNSYLSVFVGRFLIDSSEVRTILEIRTILIDGQPKPQLPAKIVFDVILHDKDINNSTITLSDLYYRNDTIVEEISEHTISDIEVVAQSDLQQSRIPNNNTKFPLIAYYGIGRLFGWNNSGGRHINYFKQKEGVFIGYEGWKNSRDINKGTLSFISVLSWYKTLEDEVNKFKQPIDELFLKLFRDTISSMVPEWNDMAYSFKDEDLIGIFKETNGPINKLPFSNLSDGYRNVIGMVADMAFRCIQLNPGLKEKAISETEGMVLIDEIDLHLHPEWQKNIINDLKRVFPKIQFIVTTHSPFIIQSVSKDELLILDESVIAGTDPWRQSIEEIAEEEMQVTDVRRSEKFLKRENIAKEYFTLVKQNDTKDSLRAKIDDAKKQLDKLTIEFSDDPAYVAMLRTQLEKAEQHAAGN